MSFDLIQAFNINFTFNMFKTDVFLCLNGCLNPQKVGSEYRRIKMKIVRIMIIPIILLSENYCLELLPLNGYQNKI